MNNFVKNLMERSRFFSRNTAPKIISIIFALVMWLYVMGEVNPEMITEVANVKVQLMNVEDLKKSGLVVIGQEDYTVNVKIVGRRNEIYKIGAQDIRVSADLRGFQQGVNSVPLDVSAPANIKIEDISPKQIKITLDEIVKRQKPVEIDTRGTAMEGFDPAEVVLSHREVIVEGPESLVNSVSRVIGEINIENRNIDIVDRIPLKAVNSEGKVVNGVEVKTRYVDITLPMHRIKSVKIVLETEGQPQKGYMISNIKLNPEMLVLKGPDELIRDINEVKAKTINIQEVHETEERKLELILPEGVTLAQTEKKPTATFTVEEIGNKEFIFNKDEITFEKLDSPYQAEIVNLPDGIKVTVNAAVSVIDKIRKEDIQIYLDAGGMKEGKYSLEPVVVAGIETDGITVIPRTIDFEITLDTEVEPTNGDEIIDQNN